METNKIYKGDCYELIKQLPDKSVDLIITDPPYQIEGIHPSGIIKKGYENRNQKEMVDVDIVNGFDLSLLDELCRVMKKVNIYIWCNKEQIYDYLTYFVKNKKCNWEMLIWGKKDPTPFCSTHYLKDKEYCLYFWETGVKLNMSYKTGKTVFLTNKNTDDRKKYGHPTIKPLDIIKTLIENSSDTGGVVFDPFLGSGTTCVAAKQTNRKYIGFELNEKYYKIATDRLEGIDKNGQLDLLAFL